MKGPWKLPLQLWRPAGRLEMKVIRSKSSRAGRRRHRPFLDGAPVRVLAELLFRRAGRLACGAVPAEHAGPSGGRCVRGHRGPGPADQRGGLGLHRAAIGLVLTAEAFNTVVEALVDLCTDQVHPLAKIAKDAAAGAVLLASAAALGVGVAVFLPRLVRMAI